ncbi:hypothetical protein [Paractinoplanes brasiliensis]|uniref:Uncharacterized protein n=1 Tax=Paractinoplanes brasiliensis TaxID=52695 RepID=A0A4V3C8M1_9ACTN|nr:hypothetical protein [Actinoplanes brasiliensis]TDO41638.1 hypothetical protein C8E87_5374 [Actinoplanes brasiliensis]GID27076.1 hypothetical protein Abr02nite_20590 [Actinoplanes brasiliensis]
MRRILALSAFLAALVTGSLLVAPAAQAATGPSATRIDSVDRRRQGDRVLVNISYTCPAGARIQLTVTVTAANGDRIAQGTRQKRVDCTGDWAATEMRVDRDLAGALFIVGQATARTVRTVCDDTSCVTIPFDESIRIS